MFGIPSLFAAIARLTASFNRMAQLFEEASDKIEEKTTAEEAPANRLIDMESANGKKRK